MSTATHPPSTTTTSPPPDSKIGGRPRANLDQHKDLILDLYAKKTPWHKIEAILLADHGLRIQGRTIMRRFKEWDVAFHRVRTDRNDALMRDRVRALWADKAARPRTDDDLHRALRADGFRVSRGAIPKVRRAMGLYRRWDEKLGRVRPDAELGNRRRRRQKYSAFTSAQFGLTPLPGEDGDGGPSSSQGDDNESGCAPLGSPPADMDSDDSHFEMDDEPEVDTPEPIRQCQNALPAPVREFQAPPPAEEPRRRGRPRKQPQPDGTPAEPAGPPSKTPRRVDPEPLTLLYAKKNA